MEERKLPNGKTCGDCHHFERCNKLISAKQNWTHCDWAPIRFVQLGVREDLGEFYRYEEVQTSETYYDEYGSRWFATVRLNLTAYKVIKKTPGGVWIACWGRTLQDRKFILMRATKKWACPTKEAALESFIARKKRHRDILESRLATVNEALEQGKKMKEKMDAVLHHRDTQEGGVSRDREGDEARPAADVRHEGGSGEHS